MQPLIKIINIDRNTKRSRRNRRKKNRKTGKTSLCVLHIGTEHFFKVAGAIFITYLSRWNDFGDERNINILILKLY